MKGIVFLIDQPLDNRNFSRFGIQTLIDSGLDVKIFDLTPINVPQIWKLKRGEIVNIENYLVIHSIFQLRQILKLDIKDYSFINLLSISSLATILLKNYICKKLQKIEPRIPFHLLTLQTKSDMNKQTPMVTLIFQIVD